MAYLRLSALFWGLSVFASGGQSGKQLYDNYCRTCHSKDGSGGPVGANLRGKLRHGGGVQSVMKVIQFGVPGTQMPSFQDLPAADRRKLAEYVLSLNRRATMR
jgi:mono/diheme cytochrome c family protein